MAKKRRKQEPGARLAKCSPAVALTQQSWRSGNHYLGLFGAAALPAPANPAVGRSGAAHRSQLGNRRRSSPTRESTRTDIARPTTKVNSARPARFRESRSTIRTTFAAPDLSIAAVAHSEVMTSNIHHARNGSRHFCAAGAFCASFRHVMTLHAPCAPRAESASIQGRTTSCATCRRRF